MGGSGGYFSGRFKPSDLRQQVRDAESKAMNDSFEAEVSNLLNSLLADINKRDTEAISKRLETIKAALEKEVEGTVKLSFGGSVAKHTYVDGLSDIDALVILNRSELTDMEPREVRSYFAKRLRQRFPQNDVNEGDLAVTVTIDNQEIQLLPALRQDSGIRVVAQDGKSWSTVIRPDRFADKLTAVNQQLSGKVVPTIKLAKSILANFPERYRLNGYHIESLAIEAFRKYDGPQTTKAMLLHFLGAAKERVRQPIKDSTGQSLHVDDYLGPADNPVRRVISDTIGRVNREMQNADGARSVDQWRDILGVLPAI